MGAATQNIGSNTEKNAKQLGILFIINVRLKSTKNIAKNGARQKPEKRQSSVGMNLKNVRPL